LTFSGALGYNSARFDRNAVSPAGVLIYPQGSTIPNSGAPWTASLSGEYDLSLFAGQNWYFRTDWTRTSRLPPTGAMLQGSPEYDPLLLPNPAYAVLNSRLGVRLLLGPRRDLGVSGPARRSSKIQNLSGLK